MRVQRGPPFQACHQQREKTEKIFRFLVEMITVLILLLFSPLRHDSAHWILLVGVEVWVPSMTSIMASV